jgi:hypothetical protein
MSEHKNVINSASQKKATDPCDWFTNSGIATFKTHKLRVLFDHQNKYINKIVKFNFFILMKSPISIFRISDNAK